MPPAACVPQVENIDVYEITRYNLGIFKLVENRTKILK
jgi:hypothetical protein